MPAQDRLGGDKERRPTSPWHQSGQGGDERPVGPGELRSADLTSQHSQLVAKHQDLSVLGDVVHPMQPSELNEATDQAVEEGEGHGPAGSLPRSLLVKPLIRLLVPSGRIGSADSSMKVAWSRDGDEVLGTNSPRPSAVAMGQRPVALLLTPFRRRLESLQISMSTGPTDLPAKRPWWTFRECQFRRPVGEK